MKRRILYILTILVLLLSGCEKQGEGEPFNPAQTVQALADAGCFSEMLEELDVPVAHNLYGFASYDLTCENVTGSKILYSSGATCEQVAVLVFDSDDAAERAVQALEDFVDYLMEANKSYRPAEVTKLESAVLVQRGASVVLVVCADNERAATIIAEL